jgi:uncharacterized protein with HEPN domain
MNRSVLHRLLDIVESAELLTGHARGLDAATLAANPLQRDAALFRISVIGEAADHLPAELIALAPEIPWHRVYGMRNHIVHAYWQIDLKIVAETIEHDVEPLKIAAMRLAQIARRVQP